MYLFLLQEEKIQKLFLSLAYLVAVAELETDASIIPQSGNDDDLGINVFKFPGFSEGFVMNNVEFMMLRRCAAELQLDHWPPLHNRPKLTANSSLTNVFRGVAMGMAGVTGTLLGNAANTVTNSPANSKIYHEFKEHESALYGLVSSTNLDKVPTKYLDIVFDCVDLNSDLGNYPDALSLCQVMLSPSLNDLSMDESIRQDILGLMVHSLLRSKSERKNDDDHSSSYADSLSVQEKKTILFECIATAQADGEVSPMEIYVINEICKIFALDEDLVEEFMELSVKYTKLFHEGLEIINE